MVSITAIGILLYTTPFCIIAVHSLREYLKDRQNSKKKHVFYAFISVSIGFILDLIGGLLVSPDMGPNKIMVVNILLRLFDAFNMIGVFWLFVFLTDFLEKWKRHIPFVVIHLGITFMLIFLTPAGLTVLEDGFVVERADTRAVAVLVFWFLYWGLIAYEFLKHSRLMTKKVAIRRSQMMCVGGVFAVLAYVFVILAKVYNNIMLGFSGEIFAILAGVVFYAGFVAPEWLKRRFGK